MERLTEKHYLAEDHYMKCSDTCHGDMDCIDCPAFDQFVERLAAYEDIAELCGGVDRLRELAEADKAGRCAVLPPEEKALDSSVEYTEICALYHFCVDLGIKCTIERLYDGYAVRFPDGSDFAQHHGTYGGTEGYVEPAIGDTEFDYSAIRLNLAKELVKKYKGKLEGK